MLEFSEILDFWFGPPQAAHRGRPRKEWFRKNADFDAEIRRRFANVHQDALNGRLAAWEATPHAALALVVVLDQFARNMFRDSPGAFAADAAALGVARRVVDKGFDRLLRPIERCFVYMPFEHAEDLAAQRRALDLFATLGRERLLTDVWGYSGNMFTRTVDVHVAGLRQKLEPEPRHPRYFVTVQGLGYKFLPQGA